MSEATTSTAERSPQDRRRHLEALLRKKAEQSHSFPISFAQQRLWILDRLDPENPVYNIPLAMRLRGPLNVEALHRTLGEIVARHESLRTKIVAVGDQPMQVVEPARPQKLTIVDLEHVDPSDREAEATRRAETEARRAFRLDEAPLFRVLLLRFSATDHVLVVVMHHIISDDWSMAVLFREVAFVYQAFRAGEASPLPPLPVQYPDFTVWQRQRLQGEPLERLLEYWRGRLENVAPLEFPTDQPRSLSARQSGATETFRLPAALTEQLRELARREGATLFMLALAAFEVLLYRYSGQEDFAVGSPIAGRVSKETEGLVGFFVNTLVLRANLAGNPTFRELLGRVRETALGAFQHQELPFERLVEAVNPDRESGRHPLFQVTFSLERAPWPEVTIADIQFSVLPLETGTSKFDLSFGAREEKDGLSISAEYHSGLFSHETIRRMLGHYQILLESIVGNPDVPIAEAPLLAAAERRQVLVEWNQTSGGQQSELGIPALFAAQAARTPDATALIDGPRQWTYRELHERANQLAHALQARGVGPDRLVAVRLPRSAELIVGLLGVLKAGGAYLPLDPLLPAERLQFMLADAQVEVVITAERLRGDLPAGPSYVLCMDTDRAEIERYPIESPPSLATSDHLAYVIYTSGSTGRPKGVMIEHRALTNYTEAAAALYEITSSDRVLQFASASFDAHVEEIYPCLTRGGTLVLRDDDMLDCRTCLARCDEWELTFVSLPTGFWNELTSEIAAQAWTPPASLRIVIIGGEQALPERVATWFGHVGDRVRLFNTYGPTEATVVATAAELSVGDARAERVPIGRPLLNYRAYVLDASLQPVPIGVRGELYLGGASLARGYLNRPELTSERFIADPFAGTSGARMYKTGDVVRWRPDGCLDFVGRTDQQVKIRGFRIEPGEIESALLRHAGVKAAVVVAQDGPAGGKFLAAYVVANGETAPTAAELRRFLGESLPDYMIPSAFVPLASVPLNSSGKVDHRALPQAAHERDESCPYVPPRTPDEEFLADIWREVLHVDQVGVYDNFFMLGGHSLLATQVVSRIAGRLHVELPLRDLFQSPTIAGLAQRIATVRSNGESFCQDPIPVASRDRELLPSFMQQSLWVLDQLEPGSPVYNIPMAIRLDGAIDVDALNRALNEVVCRHESLRTKIVLMADKPVQVIEAPSRQELTVIDLQHLNSASRETEAVSRATALAKEPFRLDQSPLFRVSLLRLSAVQHVLVLVVHHVIADDWSMGVLSNEFVSLYQAFKANLPSPLRKLDIQYADYTVWQRQRLQGETLERLLDYWRPQLQGVAFLELPADLPHSRLGSPAGATETVLFPSSLVKSLREVGRRQGATLYMTLLGAYQVLLGRYSGQDDFAVGSPIANRTRPEIEPLIGCFINMVVLRANLAGNPTFRELLGRVRETALGAFQHQELPFERLVEAVNPDRESGRHPLFQVTFSLENVPVPNARFDGLALTAIPLDTGTSKFDLSFGAREEKDGLSISAEYHSGLFSHETIRRMLGHYQILLESIVGNPDVPIAEAPLLAAAERRQVLVEWNQTSGGQQSELGIPALFAAQAARTPDATALIDGPRQWTYRELHERANQLAHALQARGVGPDRLVAVRLPRSAELIVGLLGVLKAGGAYLPLDPLLPAERLQFTLADAQVEVVITAERLRGDLPAGPSYVLCMDTDRAEIERYPIESPPSLATSDHLAYVIYTSGSTGRPKGVMIEHRALTNYTEAAAALYEITSSDRVLQFASASFDAHVEEIYPCLTRGGTLVLRDDDMLDCRTCLARCDEWELTFVSLPTGFWNELTSEIAAQAWTPPASLRIVIIGGEQALPERVATWFGHVGDRVRLFNTYGPTEATVVATAAELSVGDARAERVPIGRPLLNYRAYVLDASLQPVPIGVRGELYLGGASLARGYLNRPELTSERFIADPFAGTSGARMYKTGDVVRWRPDGCLDFVGRTDQQVKIRGFRIEPGEIESALLRHAGVKAAVVVAQDGPAGGKFLAAYVVANGETAPTAAELRRFLGESLPDYMIPSAFVPLASVPLNSSGKVDHRALPQAAHERDESCPYVPPRTPDEEFLADIWREVLHVDQVGVYDNFFMLGGHSLLATQLVTRIAGRLQVDLRLRDVFQTPTIAELAERVSALQLSGRLPQLPAIQPVGRDLPLPMSYGQEALWIIDQLQEGESPYVTFPAARVRGPLNVSALERSLNELFRRHESLRTTFGEAAGRPIQVIAAFTPQHLAVVDLSQLPAAQQEAEVRRYAWAQSQRRMNLSTGPLARLELLRLSEQEHVVLISMHHIIYDGWSMALLDRELLTTYFAFVQGLPSPLGELPIQYADFSVWQRERLQGETLDELNGYWLKQLADLPTLELPTDHPRPAARIAQGASRERRLSGALSQAIEELSRQQRVTPFMTLVAAFQTLLHRYSGQEDFPLGTPLAGRLRPETEGLIGYFINLLVLRADLSGDPPFRELLARVRETALDAFEHQELPFERLVQELNPPRDPSRHPLFQVMVVLQNTPQEPLQLPGLEFSEMHNDLGKLAEDFDLALIVTPGEQGWGVALDYRSDLFDAATIERLLEHFQTLLEGIVADPDLPVAQVPLLSVAERERMLVAWNDTAVAVHGDVCLQTLFASQAARTPDALAIVCNGRELTYRELDGRANQLARHLQSLGVGPDTPVGICLQRSVDVLVAILGVLKAGGAYVPMDPRYPRERLAAIIQDCGAPVLLTAQKIGETLADCCPQVVCLDAQWNEIAGRDCAAPVCRATGRNAAYIIYTSGSTGTPKGVLVSHGNIVHSTVARFAYYGSAPERFLLFPSFAFDSSVAVIFWTLCQGGALVVPDDDAQRDIGQLAALVEQHRVTHWLSVPSAYAVLLSVAEREALSSLKVVIVAGESCPGELYRRHRQVVPGAEFYNEYGPTEGTVWSSVYRATDRDLAPASALPIGRPIQNMRAYVLDGNRAPVPVGVPGELHIAGSGIAVGYLDRPELTRERFVADPFAGGSDERMYKTGDRVKWLADGNLSFLGRADDQVKIRGFRVELGEIEAVLRRREDVQDVVVAVRDDLSAGKQLVAYVVAPTGVATELAELREFVARVLPDYMVPAAFVSLDAIPLTANGKINYKALPRPTQLRDESCPYVAPRTAEEVELAEIWREVLSVERVGIHDNFFMLGGHSLLATQLVTRIAGRLQVDLRLRDVFQTPTIAELAERVSALQLSGRLPQLPAIQPVGRDLPLPMSYGQEALWIIDQLQEGESPYVTFPAARVRGPLNVSALERSLNELFRRHESLRTTFGEAAGRPIQVIAAFTPQHLAVVDLSQLPAAQQEAEVRRYAWAQSQRRMNLSTGPLARLELLRLSEQEHVVLISMHHIIYDGWSMALLDRELLTTYFAFVQGLPSPLGELPIQYADFSVWQRERLQGETLDELNGYWLKQLADLPTLELPTDHPRPAARIAQGASRERRLSGALSQAIEELSRQQRVTPFMTLVAAFQTLLHRYSGQEDFPLGTPLAGRLRPETEGLIGYFINLLVLRADLSGDPPFRELLARVRETALDAFEHQELPFERLVQELNPPRDPSRHPLFQVMVVLQNTPQEPLQLPGLEFSEMHNDLGKLAEDFDLALIVTPGEQGWGVALDYRSDLFDAATIERLLEHFQTLLEGIVADPDLPLSALSLMGHDERQKLLVDWNQTQAAVPPHGGLHEFFEERVTLQPEAVAAVFEGQSLSYGELNARANQLAHYLQAQGVGPEVLVGICLERSLGMAVALLAVLKAGGAYVPLDPDYPRDRLDFVMADSRPAVLVTTSDLADRVSAGSARWVGLDTHAEAIARESAANLPCRVTPDNAIYVIYTSGSTGTPKGAVNLHRGVCNNIFWETRFLGLDATDRILFKTPLSFDVSVVEFFRGLICGGCVVIARPGGHQDPSYLVELIVREGVTTVEFVPSLLRVLLDEQQLGRCRSLRRVCSGAEALSPDLVQQFFQQLPIPLCNIYGPTETAIGVSGWRCTPQDDPVEIVPIGRPVSNVRLYILDDQQNPLPMGVPGELYVGGVAVGRGYLNRPELTAERFVSDPFSGIATDRLYKTGDLCRYLADGNIQYLGRRDEQVKIRGFRIELGEIEAALSQVAGVREAVVVPHASPSGDQRLAAYVVPQPQVQLTREALWSRLRERLPPFMVPSFLTVLEALPLTPSGKLNRRALPAPDDDQAERATRYVPPSNDVEKRLAEIWSEVLHRQRVGIHDDFFEMGGHSLLALQAMVQARAALDTDLPVVALFAAPTIAKLAQQIAAKSQNAIGDRGEEATIIDELVAGLLESSNRGGQSLIPLRPEGSAIPLFCIHGLGGHVGAFLPLAKGLAAGRAVFGLQSQGLSAGQQPHDRIEEMAAFYRKEIQTVQPRGPYLLAGWSMGGIIALETAQQLTAVGEQVALVAMFDTYLDIPDGDEIDPEDQSVMRWIAPLLNLSMDELKALPLNQQWERIAERANVAKGIGVAEIRRLAEVCQAQLAACARYRPQCYDGSAVLFPADRGSDGLDPQWRSLCPRLCVEPVPGNHYSMLRKPAVDVLVERMDHYLAGAIEFDETKRHR